MIHISKNDLIRLMNSARGKFWNLVPKSAQKAVFKMESGDQPTGLQGWLPTWVYTESPTLAAGDSDDSTMGLQNGFNLMAFTGSAHVTDVERTGADFGIQVGDVVQGAEFTPRRIFNGNLAGVLGTARFLNEAYEFQGAEPQCSVRITNLAAVTAAIQLVMFGYVPPMDTSDAGQLVPAGV
jgi:hypothetical protein